MKYRYIITCEGTVESDSEAHAEDDAFAALEAGSSMFTICLELIEEAPQP
jgi:hypothetical protein